MKFQEMADIINCFSPVSGANAYPNGTLILQRCRSKQQIDLHRGKIKNFSKQSMSRLVFLVTETRVEFISMFTATYGKTFPTSGLVGKKHLHLFLTKMKQHYDCSYLWFSEFQKRGALHFHILLTIEPSTANRQRIARLWVNSTGEYQVTEMMRVSNHKNAFEEIRKRDNATAYLTTHATKAKQKTIPKQFSDMGRWWGASRDVKNSIPEPVHIECYDQDIRCWYPRLENVPLLPKIVFASRDASRDDNGA